jgi:hypothetical protein
MEINPQAPLIARKHVFIQAPPQVVWKIQTDINNWSRWQPDITASSLDSSLIVGSVFRWKSGRLNVTSTIQVISPSQEMGWIGRALGAHAEHVWRLTPQDSGTLVTTEESMEGWPIRLMKFINPKFLDDSLDTWLHSLKTQAEKRLQTGS